ncbi:MAG TPA: DUF6788 family protein [Chloroflexota bacterium]|nr:DUF6788 family protein [Chloroflexota bacterium]
MRYRQQYRRCGKSNCRVCTEGPGHGPYWYEVWREGGQPRTRYIGKDLPPDAGRSDEPTESPPLDPMTKVPNAEDPPPAAEMTSSRPVQPPRHTHLRILLLGQFRVEVEGAAITDWRRQSAATLLKFLLLADQQRVRREAVMVVLSPKGTVDAARSAVATAVHALRHALEPGMAAGQPSRFLSQEGELLTLRLGPEDFVDVLAFERALAAADMAADPLDALETAAGLYGGDLLPEETAEWCVASREAFRLRWHGGLLALQEALARHGRHDAAIAALHRLLTTDPTQEEAAYRLMMMLARQGRRAEALRIYERVKQALRREVRAAPSVELEAMARTLRAGEALPRRSRPPVLPGPAAPAQQPFSLRRAVADLIGRDVELAQVRACLGAAREGKGQLVILTGEAGIGKTRLAEEGAEAAALLGFTVLWGRSGEGEHDLPYASFSEALRAYSRTRPAKALRRELQGAEAVLDLAPELAALVGLHPPAPLGNAGAERLRLWTSIRAVFAAAGQNRPVALILDDLHWADEATLGLLMFLARRSGDLRLLLIGTMRDDVPPTHPMRELMLEGHRQGGMTTIELRGLLPEHVSTLAGRVLGVPVPFERASALHAQCNGNPFFVTELAALLAARRQDEGTADRAEAAALDGEEALPTTVRQTLARRLDRLEMGARALLRAGAVIGLRFSAELLAILVGQDRTATEDALDEAVASGLLREEDTGYVLTHNLLRRALYEELLPGQRRRLHERAGLELAARHEQRGNPSAETVAYHFVRTNDHRRAVNWLERAGDHAATVHAPSLAIQHYSRACAYLDDPAVPLEEDGARGADARVTLARLRERLGDLWLLEGDYAAAQAEFTRARAFAATPMAGAELWRKEGLTWERRTDYERALAAFARAEAGCGSDDPGTRASFLSSLALNRGEIQYLRGEYATAQESAERALSMLGEGCEDATVGRARNLQGRIACMRGEFKAAEERHRAALAIFERLGDLMGTALIWNSLGAVAWYRCDYLEAERCYRETLALREHLGDQDGIATTWNNLGLMAAGRGEIDEAEECHRRALSIQERTGNHLAVAHSLDSLGLMAYQRCEYDLADSYYRRALVIRQEKGDPSGLAHCQHSLGLLALDRGDYAAAEHYCLQSLAINEQLPHPTSVAHDCVHLGAIALARGDLQKGREWLERGLRVGQEVGYEPAIADAWRHEGLLACEQGGYPTAIRLARRARRLIRRLGGVEEELLTSLDCVRVYILSGNSRRAARLLKFVSGDIERRGVGPARLQGILVRAELALALGDPAGARDAAREGLEGARARGQRREEGICLVLLGRAARASGDSEEGKDRVREGMVCLEAIGANLEAARAGLALAEMP